MKYKITSVFSKETGKCVGYYVSYKPFPIIPHWVRCGDESHLCRSIELAEHDIVWLLSLNGKLKQTYLLRN